MNRKAIGVLAPFAVSVGMVLLASSVSSPVSAADATEHHHHQQVAAPALKLNAGKPWQTDAPLRDAMMNIRQATQGAEALQKAKGWDATQANALAKTIRDNIAFMVANCQLPPDADATLHVLIGRLATAADQLEQSEHRAAALIRIHDTLQLYPHYFYHTGWSAPLHEH